MTDKDNTAYHEAGHAVAYLARGYDFQDITIVEDGWKIGEVRPKPGNTIRVWDIPFISAAGPIAEWHHCELIEYFDDYFDDVDYSDDYELREHFDNVRLGIELVKAYPDRFTIDFNDDLTQLIESSNWVDDDARVKMWRLYESELTSLWWPAVEAVAKALLEKKTLQYDEAKQLYEATAYKESVDQDLSARLRNALGPKLSMRFDLDAKQAEDAKVAA